MDALIKQIREMHKNNIYIKINIIWLEKYGDIDFSIVRILLICTNSKKIHSNISALCGTRSSVDVNYDYYEKIETKIL